MKPEKPLYDLVKDGNFADLEKMLEKKEKNEKKALLRRRRTSDSKSIIHAAAESGNMKMFEWAIKNYDFKEKQEALADIVDSDGRSVLFSAVLGGNLNIFRSLIRDYGLDPTERDRDGKSLFHTAASCGECDIFLELLKIKKVHVNFRVDTDNSDRTILHDAVINLRVKMVKMLIDEHGFGMDDVKNLVPTLMKLYDKDKVDLFFRQVSMVEERTDSEDYRVQEKVVSRGGCFPLFRLCGGGEKDIDMIRIGSRIERIITFATSSLFADYDADKKDLKEKLTGLMFKEVDNNPAFRIILLEGKLNVDTERSMGGILKTILEVENLVEKRGEAKFISIPINRDFDNGFKDLETRIGEVVKKFASTITTPKTKPIREVSQLEL